MLGDVVIDSKVDISSVALKNTTLDAYIHPSVAYGSDKYLVTMIFPGPLSWGRKGVCTVTEF